MRPRRTRTTRAGVVFVRRQRTLADPLVDLRLFRVPAFSASLATITLSLFTAFGVFLFIAQYLQSVLGLSPQQAGLWSVPAASGLIAGSLLAPWVARMVRPASAMAGGLALAAVGSILLARVEGDSGLTLLVTAFVLIFLGIAPVGTLATDLLVGAASPERAGAASAISETGAELGGALGIAVLGSIGAAFYRRGMADLMPADVPTKSADAAQETIGGAVKGGITPARRPRLRAARCRRRGLWPRSPSRLHSERRRGHIARGRRPPAAQDPAGPRRRAGPRNALLLTRPQRLG